MKILKILRGFSQELLNCCLSTFRTCCYLTHCYLKTEQDNLVSSLRFASQAFIKKINNKFLKDNDERAETETSINLFEHRIR